MRIIEPLELKFEVSNWALDPELALIDTILELFPNLIKMFEEDITQGRPSSNFGRQDTPSVEQILRAAIYKQMKNLDYRSLEYAQEDSRICELFLKINRHRPYSFQVWQKYISRIGEQKLEKFMVALNKIAINEDLEDLEDFRQDSTVIETNIHYPTNNSLVWDCVKKMERLLKHLKKEIGNFIHGKYGKKVKKLYFKINVSKNEEERLELFVKQLKLFKDSINEVSEIIKQKESLGITVKAVKAPGSFRSIITIDGNSVFYDRTERNIK